MILVTAAGVPDAKPKTKTESSLQNARARATGKILSQIWPQNFRHRAPIRTDDFLRIGTCKEASKIYQQLVQQIAFLPLANFMFAVNAFHYGRGMGLGLL